MKLNVTQLLEFFDERPADSHRHATAITALLGEDLALGLMVRHLRASWDPSTEIDLRKCTTGQRTGPRLDGWIRTRRNGMDLLLQVEVKNWSAHALGGKVLPRGADPETVRTYKIERWEKQWDGETQTFKNSGVRKVLTPMKPPDDLAQLQVEPAVCFWDAMHPTGGLEPLFAVPVHVNGFDRAWVFSMSAYLRSLDDTSVDIEMPRAKERLEWIRRFTS